MAGGDVAILSEWERDALAGGHCVRIAKNDRARERPLPGACTEDSGALLVFRWRDDFTVHHSSKVVQSCDVKNAVCEVLIADG
jgi:hypothetical protein